MNNISISIIVPCYNQAQYLDEALQSVLDQTYTNWECIIVNDGSPDDTKQIAQKWVEKDSRFKYIYKENGGLSSARNAGLAVAVGEFIQFLDCDDILEKEKLRFQVEFMYQNPVIDIAVSGYRYFDSGSRILKILGRDNFKHEVFLTRYDSDVKEVFKLGNPMVISASLYKRNVFEKVGFFDINLKALEDWDFNFRCALNNLIFEHIGYAKETKTLIRLHNKSMMSDVIKLNNQVEVFKTHIGQNALFIKYFGICNENSFKNKHIPNKSLKNNFILFIPPILLKLYKYVK